MYSQRCELIDSAQEKDLGTVTASSLKASPQRAGLIKNANELLRGVRDGKGWKVMRKCNIVTMQTSSAAFSEYNKK